MSLTHKIEYEFELPDLTYKEFTDWYIKSGYWKAIRLKGSILFSQLPFSFQQGVYLEYFLSVQILIEVRPIDDWQNWGYLITIPDCMAPLCYLPSNYTQYCSYNEALYAGMFEGAQIRNQHLSLK